MLERAREGLTHCKPHDLHLNLPHTSPPCKEAPGRTDTQTRAQDRGLTLQQPHEEPGGGHKNEMGRSDVGEQRGEDREEPPG